MSQVIMILLFPIGLYFYFFVERKNTSQYQQIFNDFQRDIKQNSRLSKEAKILQFKMMLMKNGYTIKIQTNEDIKGEKKILSMSLFMMSLGVFYIGAVFYLLYFYYIQKAHEVHYRV